MALTGSVLGLAAALFTAAAPAEVTQAGWNPAGLQTLGERAFDESKLHTDALLIVDGSGKILFERYGRGYTAETRHYGWSMTKSISMAIFGIAESEGKISRNDPVAKFFPDYRGSIWDKVPLKSLLSMSTGVKWLEAYEYAPFNSNVVTALYRSRWAGDFGGYRLTVSKEVAPVDERFNYASGETNLLMKALHKALGAEYDDYPWKKLFDPIGMKSAVLERDAAGDFVGSSYGHATPRDFARFGLLFLHGGKWPDAKGKPVQVVPEEITKLAATPSPAMHHLRLDHFPEMPYGYSWWLNRPQPEAQIGKPIPAFPDDAFFASGHYGQSIVVIPSWNVVAVRLGNDGPPRKFNEAEFGQLMANARTKK